MWERELKSIWAFKSSKVTRVMADMDAVNTSFLPLASSGETTSMS